MAKIVCSRCKEEDKEARYFGLMGFVCKGCLKTCVWTNVPLTDEQIDKAWDEPREYA